MIIYDDIVIQYPVSLGEELSPEAFFLYNKRTKDILWFNEELAAEDGIYVVKESLPEELVKDTVILMDLRYLRSFFVASPIEKDKARRLEAAGFKYSLSEEFQSVVIERWERK